MSKITIDYDTRVQNALRGVVRDVLCDAAKDGLEGDHHFYVAFKTQAEGVNIPAHLASRFPDEMTIVLQHKFWGLKIFDDHFEVGLSFNQKPEHLTIPFNAILGFVDPSVQFALQFHDDDFTSVQEGIDEMQDEIIEPEVAETDTAINTPESDSDKVVTLDAFRRK